MVHRKYYAVAVGHTPGIYTSWPECEQQVIGVPNQQYRLFCTEQLAQDWLSQVWKDLCAKEVSTPTGGLDNLSGSRPASITTSARSLRRNRRLRIHREAVRLASQAQLAAAIQKIQDVAHQAATPSTAAGDPVPDLHVQTRTTPTLTYQTYEYQQYFQIAKQILHERERAASLKTVESELAESAQNSLDEP